MLCCRCSVIFGGLAILTAQLVAQTSGAFVRTGNMVSGRSWHTSTLLLDGKVLVTGGLSADGHTLLASAELYDPEAGIFVPTGSMKVARQWHAATRITDGRVLITGGYRGTEAEIYDPSTGTFATTGNMTAARALHGMTLLNSGKVLVTGGLPMDGSIAYVASTEIYDPETGVFTSAGDMNVPRFDPRTTVLGDGSVLIAPGSDGADFTTSEVYDPRNGSFRSLPFMPLEAPNTGLAAATSNVLPSGKVLLTLHVPECDFTLPFASFYDPATSAFSAAPTMHSNHCQQAGTPLADGNVLIVGSINDATGPKPAAEVFDAQSGRFSVTGTVVAGRFNPRVTLLNSGKVLITGSAWGPLAADATAELYEPAVPAPMLRLLPESQPAILHGDNHVVVSSSNPAKAGEVLEVYCTGLVPGSTISPQVVIGGRIAEVLYFGGAPGFAGLNQVNVRVPANMESGRVGMWLTYLGRSSNAASLSMR